MAGRDHHIHTRYSPDALYRVVDHVRHAGAYGLDWMVITDHGSIQHAKIDVEKVNPDIRAARAGPGRGAQGVRERLRRCGHRDDRFHAGKRGPAIAGVNFLADAVRARRVRDALFLANHPARKGIDSPHEIRGWRDAQPRIAVGMEGAPGHQAAGIKAPTGPGSGRGFYDNAIQRVVVLAGGGDPSPDTVLDTHDHVRPQWMDSSLTLITVPAAGAWLAPFELPNPTPCCADHTR